MGLVSRENLEEALCFLGSTIRKCEKAQLKFAKGAAQDSLLTNRIKALYTAKALMEQERGVGMLTRQDLEKALPPVASIIHKLQKAQSKYDEGTAPYRRLAPMLRAMRIAEAFLLQEIASQAQ